MYVHWQESKLFLNFRERHEIGEENWSEQYVVYAQLLVAKLVREKRMKRLVGNKKKEGKKSEWKWK